MEIIVEQEGLNGVSNYEPLKAFAIEKTKLLKDVVVTEDNLADIKVNITELRKIAKAASDYRISIKKQHEQKIEKTVNQLKEITEIFTSTADTLDSQAKEIENGFKQEKKNEIESYFNSVVGDIEGLLTFDKVFNEKMLNKGSKMSDIQKEIDDIVSKVRKGINSIRGMDSKFETEMIRAFIVTLDMASAIDKANELEENERRINAYKEKQAKAQEAVSTPVVAEPVVKEETVEAYDEEVKQYDVRLYMTERQKNMFKNFVTSNGIKYTSVPKGEKK